jgi:hypothetical protein
MTEIRKARETEKQEKRRKLFPIRLCSFETLRDWTCFDADTGKDLAWKCAIISFPTFPTGKSLRTASLCRRPTCRL